MAKVLTRFFLFCLLVPAFFAANAQVDPDSVFRVIRGIAGEGNHEEALGRINLLRAQYPANKDYSLYAARLYYWSGHYEEAYDLVSSLFDQDTEPNAEALRLQADIALPAKKYEELLSLTSRGIVLYPDESIDYFLLRAQALEKLDRDTSAIEILDRVPRNSPKYGNAQYLKTEILKKQTNTISLGYLYTGFANPYSDPWHIGHFQYLVRTPKSAYVARVNLGYLFGKTAVQAEFDAYPKVAPRSYMYLNAGVSDGSIFPLLRMGAEYYTDFREFNASAGLRYLYFSSTNDVLLLTGHFAVNRSAWKISYRPYILVQTAQWLPTHILSVRHSFENKEAWVQLDLQYGNTPYFFFSISDFARISSYRIGIDSKFRLGNHVFLQPIFMYELEEYLPRTNRDRYTLQLILSKRF